MTGPVDTGPVASGPVASGPAAPGSVGSGSVASGPVVGRVRAGSAALLIGILLFGANLRVAITPVGPVIEDIRDALHLSASTASALISLPLLAFALVSPIAPVLATRLGVHRTLGLALIVLAAAILVRSAPVPAGLWIGTAGLGIAIAVLNVVLPSLVKQEFPDRIGQVTGLYSAVQSGAAALAAGLAVPLASVAPGGWRTALAVWAGLAIVGFVVVAPRMRADTDRRPGPSTALPDGGAEVTRWRSPWGSALAWQVTAFMGLQSTVFYVLITWLPSFEESRGVSAAQAGLHQLVLNASAIVGSLVTSRVIHLRRDQRVIVLTSSVLVAGGLAIVFAAPGAAIVGVAIEGVGAGAAIVLALSLFGLRTGHPVQAGRLSGMAQSIGYLLAAAGPILIGTLHDATGSWVIAIGVLFPVLAAQLVAGLLAARDRTLG